MGFFSLLLVGVLSSCSLLFPDRTAPKSSSYLVTPPPEPWKKLHVGDDANSTETLQADIAYENPDTGAMISLSTLCRKYNTTSLRELSLSLVRGIDDRQVRKEEERLISGVHALDTTYEGLVDKVHLLIHTVVLVKDYCTYDFIYVAVPSREKNSAETFEQFIQSFRAD